MHVNGPDCDIRPSKVSNHAISVFVCRCCCVYASNTTLTRACNLTNDASDSLAIAIAGLPVCPVACQLSPWSSWSNCSATCGGTTLLLLLLLSLCRCCCSCSCSRCCFCPLSASIARFLKCSHAHHASVPSLIPYVGGVSTRTRWAQGNCATTDANLTQYQSCNVDACSNGCVLSDWSTWSSCSASCGAGFSYRCVWYQQSCAL